MDRSNLAALAAHTDAVDREVQRIESGHHAFSHRRLCELVHVRDALVRRHNDALSHLRLGRRRTRSHRDTIRSSFQAQRMVMTKSGTNAVVI
jgi:hypothetical protein